MPVASSLGICRQGSCIGMKPCLSGSGIPGFAKAPVLMRIERGRDYESKWIGKEDLELAR
jgi:hypothetical protein